MKLLILLFCGLIALSSARFHLRTQKTSQTWAPVPQSDWETGSSGDSLRWGFRQVLNRAGNQGRLPAGNFEISHITSVQQQQREGSREIRYRFNVIGNNGEGSVFDATYTVEYLTLNEQKELASYSWKLKTTVEREPIQPTPIGQYEELSEISPELDAALNETYQTVYQNAVRAGKVTEDTYHVVSRTVKRQTMNTGNSYECRMELQNDRDTSLDVSFILYWPTTGERLLTWSHYKVQTGYY